MTARTQDGGLLLSVDELQDLQGTYSEVDNALTKARARVRRVWPDPDQDWVTRSPQQWAERLLIIRARGAARIDQEVAAPAVSYPLDAEPTRTGYSAGTYVRIQT